MTTRIEDLLSAMLVQQQAFLDRIDGLERAMREIATEQRKDLILIVESLEPRMNSVEHALVDVLPARFDELELGQAQSARDVCEAVASLGTELGQVGDAVDRVGESTNRVADELNSSEEYSFAALLLHEFQWHKELTLGAQLVDGLRAIDASIGMQDR